MQIVQCPSCQTNVVKKSDGSCPACGSIKEPDSVPVRFFPIDEPESPVPDVAQEAYPRISGSGAVEPVDMSAVANLDAGSDLISRRTMEKTLRSLRRWGIAACVGAILMVVSDFWVLLLETGLLVGAIRSAISTRTALFRNRSLNEAEFGRSCRSLYTSNAIVGLAVVLLIASLVVQNQISAHRAEQRRQLQERLRHYQ